MIIETSMRDSLIDDDKSMMAETSGVFRSWDIEEQDSSFHVELVFADWIQLGFAAAAPIVDGSQNENNFKNENNSLFTSVTAVN